MWVAIHGTAGTPEWVVGPNRALEKVSRQQPQSFGLGQ